MHGGANRGLAVGSGVSTALVCGYLVLSTILLAAPSYGWQVPSPHLNQQAVIKRKLSLRNVFSSSTADVDQLLALIDKDDDRQNHQKIRDALTTLYNSPPESTGTEDTQSEMFAPLLGNYHVACTIPFNPTERPVGGRWTRGVFRIREMWQHLLVPIAPDSVAQVVNVIVLRIFALWKLHVILRGDAYQLSPDERTSIQKVSGGGDLSVRTVRAQFDRPRLVVSSCNLFAPSPSLSPVMPIRPVWSISLGPTSSVVLDTPYCDDRIRIGKGSKGSQFVFIRTHDPAAEEWKQLLQRKPWTKWQLVGFFGSVSVGSLFTAVAGRELLTNTAIRISAALLGISAMAVSLAVLISTGGIEEEDNEKHR